MQIDILGEYAELGFSTKEIDDHFLELWFKDKLIARYNQEKVTADIIRQGCHNYLKNTAGWR